MTEERRTGNAALGFLIGAFVGAGVALLLAPSSGRVARHKIGATARRLGEGVSAELGEMKSKAIQRAHEINGDVKDAIDAGLATAANS
jgi:gas vesicle protein